MRHLFALSVFLFGCQAKESPAPPSEPPSPVPGHTAPSVSADAPGMASASASATPEPPSPAPKTDCPSDMQLVSGAYCPRVKQPCLERPRIKGTKQFKQCQRYGPSTCLSSKRRPMRFCMDRYEWPNKKGVKPRTLTTWPEARKMCAERGKRLCTTHEFNFACEGQSMKPHVYGHQRDDTACNIDRPYIARTFNYKRWDKCMKNEACRKEYDRLDQRHPAGSMPRCVSDHGVYDLNGNANEWVMREKARPPKRSGIKGGWWGPVRNRCRPITTFHIEGDWGYEVGFRCCKDASSKASEKDELPPPEKRPL